MDSTKLVYEYDTSSGTVKDPVATAGGTKIDESDISAWDTNTKVGTTDTLGSKVFKTWYFTVNSDGDEVTQINAAE